MAPLHVIAARFNPLRYDLPDRHYDRFVQHMLAQPDVRLTVVECQYGDRPFTCERPGVHHVGVRARTLLWIKEALQAIGLARLPQDWRHVALLDADIEFRRSDWAEAIVQGLQVNDVLQPWSDCYDLGPRGEHLRAHQSFMRLYREGRPIRADGAAGYTFAHPGFALAFTRQALDYLGGPIQGALGAGDHHACLALIGRAKESLPGGIHPNYRAQILRWEDRAERHIGHNVGFVPGTIEHAWHGDMANRRYVSRWDILTKHQFDPVADLKTNLWGVPELAGNKPGLRRDIEDYFRARWEDGLAPF